MIDTHAHLQWPDFDKDREQVIERAFSAGLRAIVSIGYDLDASREAVRIANHHEGIYAVVGVHPHNAKTMRADVLSSLRALAQDSKVVAIGEIGLDYYRDLSPRPRQKEAFVQQIRLARELELPVVIHDREAHADVLEILRSSGKDITGVLHCFSGSLEMAREAIELGYLISLAGPVTFPSARNLHRLVQDLPMESIMLETDCPWLAPQSHRGKRNEPAFIIETGRKVAELKEMRFDELVEVTSQNARRLFGIR
ncbi:TatD family hydrolase [[Eubacterium] cellulosolvens]